MVVGHFLLKLFWANEAIFQTMMAYNLFLLFKFDSLYNRIQTAYEVIQIKASILAGKIIGTARYIIMKLSENYPYMEVYENCRV